MANNGGNERERLLLRDQLASSTRDFLIKTHLDTAGQLAIAVGKTTGGAALMVGGAAWAAAVVGLATLLVTKAPVAALFGLVMTTAVTRGRISSIFRPAAEGILGGATIIGRAWEKFNYRRGIYNNRRLQR